MRGIQSGTTTSNPAVSQLASSMKAHSHDPKTGHMTDVAGAQDTIYLCNFRVSVDGDWLCLKELQDIEDGNNGGIGGSQMPEGGANNPNNAGTIVAKNNTSNAYNEKDKCNEKIVERDWVNYYCRCLFL